MLLAYCSDLCGPCPAESYRLEEWCLSGGGSSGRMSGQGRSVGKACPFTRLVPCPGWYKAFEIVFSCACLYKEQLWFSLTLLEYCCEITWARSNLFAECFKSSRLHFFNALTENKRGLGKQPVWVCPWDHSGVKQTQITLP